ncbi:MAG: hypothetical protein QGG09_10075 [Pirellulaceae bacterium]|nr:hypothetical protein [Pirellulaceae bacterium]
MRVRPLKPHRGRHKNGNQKDDGKDLDETEIVAATFLPGGWARVNPWPFVVLDALNNGARDVMISNRMPAVKVEYDCRGRRATKAFDDAYTARRFYTNKLKAGKNPVVRKGE